MQGHDVSTLTTGGNGPINDAASDTQVFPLQDDQEQWTANPVRS